MDCEGQGVVSSRKRVFKKSFWGLLYCCTLCGIAMALGIHLVTNLEIQLIQKSDITKPTCFVGQRDLCTGTKTCPLSFQSQKQEYIKKILIARIIR
jgi:hypothetical protein